MHYVYALQTVLYFLRFALLVTNNIHVKYTNSTAHIRALFFRHVTRGRVYIKTLYHVRSWYLSCNSIYVRYCATNYANMKKHSSTRYALCTGVAWSVT